MTVVGFFALVISVVIVAIGGLFNAFSGKKLKKTSKSIEKVLKK